LIGDDRILIAFRHSGDMLAERATPVAHSDIRASDLTTLAGGSKAAGV
jgi:hypothetical protein